MDRHTARFVSRSLALLPDLLRSGPRGRLTAADLIERQARRRPGDVFVRFEGRAQTYAQFNAAANRVAHWALAKGLGRGDVVALAMENRPEYLAVWAGLAKAGATTALINTNLRGEALAHALGSAGCRLAIVGAECGEAWSTLAGEAAALEVFFVSDPGRESPAPTAAAKPFDDEVAGYSPHDPPRSVRGELRAGDPLFYIYTSGTTGLPKAARFSHGRFVGGGTYALLAGFGRDDTMYCALPLYHTVGGVMSVHAVLRSGGTLALARRFSATRFWQDIVEMEATAFQYIGELCRYLLNQPVGSWERRHELRFAIGNGLSASVWQAFQKRFGVPRMVEFYGSTEGNVSMVNLAGRPGYVGRPAPGTKVALVRFDVEAAAVVRDERGRCVPCRDDEPGELLGRIAEGRTAAGRFEGYTSREASEKKVLRGVFEDGDAWFRTGDLLARSADGLYRFVDRIGDTFRWKGENVSTQEVAEAVAADPAVALCSVFGVEMPGSEGRAGMAAVVLDAGAALDGEALFERVERELPLYARPAFLRIQAAPDVTGTFKLRKVDLQRQGFDPAQVSDRILYRDDARRSYLRLDANTHQQVLAGDVRF